MDNLILNISWMRLEPRVFLKIGTMRVDKRIARELEEQKRVQTQTLICVRNL